MPRADAIKRKSLRFVPLPRDGELVTGEYSVAIIRIARAPLLSRMRSVATGRGLWQSVASSDSPRRQDHDDTAVDPGIARQPDTAVTRRIYFKDFSASGCREPFSLRQGRLDDLTTSRLGDGAHPNPKSPAKGGAKHPRDFCGTLPSFSVLFCARRSQRPSSPQV